MGAEDQGSVTIWIDALREGDQEAGASTGGDTSNLWSGWLAPSSSPWPGAPLMKRMWP